MSFTKTGLNNPMYGRTFSHSVEIKALISAAHKGLKKGFTLSDKTKIKISETMKGIAKSEEHKAKISVAKGSFIFVYDSKGSLVNSFSSARKAAEFFHCSHLTIISYVKNGKLFKKEWILSTFMMDSPTNE